MVPASGWERFKILINTWWYWHVSRKTRKFIPWLARKLPKKLKYYVVIHGMVTVEPNGNPEGVSGRALLELWNPEIKRNSTERV